MRILIVTDAWEPQVNGVVRTLKMTCRELGLMGHHTGVLAPGDFRSIPCPTYPEIRLALAGRASVAQRIDAFGPDCLHIATEGPLGWTARAIAQERGWPFTTAYHSRFPEYVHARVRLPLDWSYRLLRHFHNAGGATLVPTPAMADVLRERGFTRPRLWSRGVDHGTFHPDGPREAGGRRPVFLYVGRLAVEKNLDAFLKLELPGEKWVAGEGPERARLEAAHPDVRWLGVLGGPELATLYRSADVMVFPSLTDTFGLVLVESMACGTPVAAYPVPGPIDVVGRDSAGGVLDTDLRRACLAALELPRDAVHRHAQQYTWAAASAQFVQALRPVGAGREALATAVQEK
ncbi:glycosyltransferase involved in cell wall biosynthesis [Sphaerotilus hippei]|uniref:Glycosyltransferase involved in cell wall biosynthesis n=1 Tax=Sphaerotilus hippei TaxID=744406 RepID=A0A318H299_9BURK|nr:glycosyltransferase family 1 protein [Sphaerotilus hippei]PXW94776.1 glycosyltransferase involved in cell wall biosynthesis [Sphaerotilus hippei]